MKVRELIAALSELNPEADVFMATDAEGNDYKPIEEAAVMTDLLMKVDEQHPWIIETWYVEEGDDPIDTDEQAVVIWPVN